MSNLLQTVIPAPVTFLVGYQGALTCTSRLRKSIRADIDMLDALPDATQAEFHHLADRTRLGRWRQRCPGDPCDAAVEGIGGKWQLSAETGRVGAKLNKPPLRSVRARSVSQRSRTGMGGHQRSPTVQRNCRSWALRFNQLG